MWKRTMDIFPGELLGTDFEKETEKELEVGDSCKVVVDSQFQDKYENGELLPRAYERTGIVTQIDTGDEWSYQVEFEDGVSNWFKRYTLKKL